MAGAVAIAPAVITKANAASASQRRPLGCVALSPNR
jgi:hypothetical protein